MIASFRFELFNEKKINFHCEKWRNLPDKLDFFFFCLSAGERRRASVMKSIWLYVNIAQMRIHKQYNFGYIIIVIYINIYGFSRCSQKVSRPYRALPFYILLDLACSFYFYLVPFFFALSTNVRLISTWMKKNNVCVLIYRYGYEYFACRLFFFFNVCVSLFVYSSVSHWFSFLLLLLLKSTMSHLFDIAIAFCFLYLRRFFSVHRIFIDFVWDAHTHAHTKGTPSCFIVYIKKCLWHRERERDTLGAFSLFTLNVFFCCFSAALFCFVQFTRSRIHFIWNVFLYFTSFSILCIFACTFFE